MEKLRQKQTTMEWCTSFDEVHPTIPFPYTVSTCLIKQPFNNNYPRQLATSQGL